MHRLGVHLVFVLGMVSCTPLVLCLPAEADAKIIPLKGGNPGEGFTPLAEDAASIKIGGGQVTIQDVLFGQEPSETSEPGGTFAANSISSTSLGFGEKPTDDDSSLAELLHSFRWIAGIFDFTHTNDCAQYHFTGLKPGATYQVDLFTVADKDPRHTNFQVVGATTMQDTVLTEVAPKIVEYTLQPDASGTIMVRYGFAGGDGPGTSGLLSAIAVTTNYQDQGSSQVLATKIDPQTKAITVVSAHNTVRLQPWSDGTVRVEAAPGSKLPDKKSLAVNSSPDATGWSVIDKGASVELSSARMRAVVEKKDGLISLYDAGNKLLLKLRKWSFRPASSALRDGLQMNVTFDRQPSEHFFGGGVIGDNFRQQSTSIPLENDYLQIHIPILYSSKGYSFFWDNPSRGRLSVTPETISWQSSAGVAADFYVMAGPKADQCISEYRHLTGAAPLFPRWAYGFWFSRNRFSHQQEILDAAKRFREEQIPIDLLIQDYFYWLPDNAPDQGAHWGSHQFDPGHYGDPKAMISELHDQDHIHFMAVIWGKFDPSTAHYAELEKAGALFPAHGDWASARLRYYDPFDEKARQIYGRQVMESLLPLGLDAFWMDGAEPEINLDKFATFDTPNGPASQVMGAFPLMHTASVYDAQRAAAPDKRVVLLPRSAWAGEQRNAACAWTSDVNQSWSVLAWQIEGLQNYSITGLPYVTTDVGGYHPTPESDRELFLRWVEWGSFCPIFRVHGEGRPFPWEYGTEGEAIIKKFDMLRYRLLPYIYSEAARVTFASGTILRPLVMDFPTDTQAVTTWDEFMFGPSILVCPVYKSLQQSTGTVDSWADHDGKARSVSVTYLEHGGGTASSREVHAYTGLTGIPDSSGFAFSTDRQGNPDTVRIEGTFTPSDDGPLAFEINERDPKNSPVTATIDGQLVAPASPTGVWQFPSFPFDARKGTPVRFSIETKKLDACLRVTRLLPAPLKRDIYLPGDGGWYDFWTGEKQLTKQMNVETPLDMIPLYIKAGTILAMGPEEQYANEQPEAPIEIRVYGGASGSYTLYQDEGDNYDYQKDSFARIPIEWNEAKRKLTFGARAGTYPGLPEKQSFHVVWVSAGHGAGESPVTNPDQTMSYDGHELSISAPPVASQ